MSRVHPDWKSCVCCRGGRGDRVERGVSANDPDAQRRTSAQHSPRQVWENRPGRSRKLQERTNRERVCVGGGALSERAEGRQPGGNAKLVRQSEHGRASQLSYVKNDVTMQEGAALPRARPRRSPRFGAGGPSFQKPFRENLGEVVNARTVGRPSVRLRAVGGGVIHGALFLFSPFGQLGPHHGAGLFHLAAQCRELLAG